MIESTAKRSHLVRTSTGWLPKSQKVSHYQIIKNSYLIVLKPANEIRFMRHIKVSVKQYRLISFVSVKWSVCDLHCDVNNYVSPAEQ